MNLTLSDEQVFLREAARGALSRHRTVEAARDDGARVDAAMVLGVLLAFWSCF